MSPLGATTFTPLCGTVRQDAYLAPWGIRPSSWMWHTAPMVGDIATAGRDRTVQLWDAETGQEVFVLRGHSDGVNAIAFSPEGARIITNSFDSALRLWDTSAHNLGVLRRREIVALVRDLSIKLGDWTEEGRVKVVQAIRIARVNNNLFWGEALQYYMYSDYLDAPGPIGNAASSAAALLMIAWKWRFIPCNRPSPNGKRRSAWTRVTSASERTLVSSFRTSGCYRNEHSRRTLCLLSERRRRFSRRRRCQQERHAIPALAR